MRVLLGMSGGFDSTWSALMLKGQGYEIEGAAVIMHEFTSLEAAERAAVETGVKLNIIDARRKFREMVALPFADEYKRGRTPNPCVFCNPAVKFAALLEYADEKSFDYIATGHYALVRHENGRYFICRGSDEKKDQSYALWGLTQAQLSRLVLPVGGNSKSDLRIEAAAMFGPENKLSAASAADSQEICFIPDNDYAGWLVREHGYVAKPGDFIDGDGNILGSHRGVAFYTVGQRKGLGLSFGRPMYVSHIDYDSNTVTLVPSGGEFMDSAELEKLNFQLLSPEKAKGSIHADVRIRYSSQLLPAEITFHTGNRATVKFDCQARAVTPGQSAVAYDGDRVLFGGFIV